MAAATEAALMLQSTAASANVLFINMDWKASRHSAKRLKPNMALLDKTITNVVRKMNPTMICMSEMGEAKNPMTREQMQQVADQIMQSWNDAATEHIELRCMFEVGAPYMTIYIHGPIQCTCHRILPNVYYAKGEPRTAQTFLCFGPGGVTVDVINFHAPSGTVKLKDQHRKAFLTNLLQSSSKSMQGRAIGHARFLIGGDMNTGPYLLSQLLQLQRLNGVLHTQETIMEPLFGKHGDVCFLGGFQAEILTTTAEHYDPQHIPYGICWSNGSATEQPSSLRTEQQESAASSSGSQCWQNSLPPGLPTPAPTLRPMLAQLDLQGPVSKVQRGGMSNSEIEQELFALHAKHGNILKPEDSQQAFAEMPAATVAATATEHSQDASHPHVEQASQELSADASDEKATDEEATATVAATATEHSQDASHSHVEVASHELPPDKKMIYSIINEFLGKMTFDNPEAEEMLITALAEESCLPSMMHERLAEVFEPIFFEYPNGLRDRSVWQPRDTSKYIRQWHELAAMRTRVVPDAAATEHGKALSRDQVTEIFKEYMRELKEEGRQGQEGKKWKDYKCYTEAKMRRQAGSTFLANAIWTIGLPRLPSFATEQHGKQLSKQDVEAIPQAIHNILNWLDNLASTLITHRETKEYQEALRKSGAWHGGRAAHKTSGLTATEQETRKANRKVRLDMHTAKNLVKQWNERSLTWDMFTDWQRNLLHAYWNGSLQQRMNEIRSADPMCRMPLLQSMAPV